MKRNIISGNMLVVQNNCRGAYAVTIAALEAGLEIGAAMVCLQEPYVGQDFGHGRYVIWWPETGVRGECRVAIAVRRDLLNTYAFDTWTDLIDHSYFLVVDVWELAQGQQGAFLSWDKNKLARPGRRLW